MDEVNPNAITPNAASISSMELIPVDNIIFLSVFAILSNNFLFVSVISTLDPQGFKQIIDHYTALRDSKEVDEWKGRDPIDKELFSDLDDIREKLQGNIYKNNNVTEQNLRLIVQRFIDRILILRVAEDREILGQDLIRKKLEQSQTSGLGGNLISDVRTLFDGFYQTFGSVIFGERQLDEDNNEINIEDNVIEEVVEKFRRENRKPVLPKIEFTHG